METTLSFIVVQKRINTRFYLMASAKLKGFCTIMTLFCLQKNQGELDNPPPGSIVDHTITRKKWYDFFLVSQKVNQGTVSPSHYVVVHDGRKVRPDLIQREFLKRIKCAMKLTISLSLARTLLHFDTHVLQLDGACSGPSTLPICPQAGHSRWRTPSS